MNCLETNYIGALLFHTIWAAVVAIPLAAAAIALAAAMQQARWPRWRRTAKMRRARGLDGKNFQQTLEAGGMEIMPDVGCKLLHFDCLVDC
jgi:hypothetical protein